MPRKPSPPRLWLRTETDADGRQRSTWVIKDRGRSIRTGCLADEVGEAESKLREYLSEKFQPQRGGRASEVTIGDVLTVYLEEKAEGTARPKEAVQAITRLNDYFGAMSVSDIKGKTCRDFATHRKTPAGARKDLETLRAAIRHYHKEYGMDVIPTLTLPDKSTPREVYLTRSEAASLLWACLGWKKVKVGSGANAYEKWQRRKYHRGSHLARLVLIGLYTGTRPGAIKSLQWMRNTEGGWADLDRGVIFRRADGERVAHNKRKPPVKIARRLLAHLSRWKLLDGWTDGRTGHRYVVNYYGKQIVKENKAFRAAIAAAGLPGAVTPHVLRHTRGTWLAQKNVPSHQAAASLGLTVEEYERTYLHNDPDFQQAAADAY